MPGLTRLFLLPVAVCTTVGLLVAIPAAASPPSAASVLATATLSVQSTLAATENGGWIAYNYDPSNITYREGSSLTSTEIEIRVGTATEPLTELHLRSGSEPFALGTYSRFGLAPSQPDLDFGNGSDDCAGGDSHFTVRDVAYTAGNLTRLDVTFVDDCDFGSFATFGELTLGEPTTPVTLEPRTLDWPETAVGILSARAPFLVRNTTSKPITIGRPVVSGAHAADFPILANSCPTSLAAAASCQIAAGFAPSMAGTETATLTVPVGASTLASTLNGVAPTGRTGLRATSSGGDFVGADQYWDISDKTTFWSLRSSTTQFTAGSGAWRIDIGAYPGHVLAVGTYPHAGNAAGSTIGLNVSAHSRGCNTRTGTITINSMAFKNGLISTLDVAFTQLCLDNPGSALRGHFFWRAPGTSDAPVASTQLKAGAALSAGHQIAQPDALLPLTYLALSPAGDVTINGNDNTFFSTGTTGSHNTFTLTDKGNLEVHSSTGHVLWSSNTNAGPGAVATLQADNVLVLRDHANHVVWSSAPKQ